MRIMAKKPGPKPMDRDAFHEWLWEHRGRKAIVPYTQLEIASIFKMAHETINRILAEMVEDGKLKKLRPGKYQVVDPKNR